jgi:5-methyltetrahydropteroyltriglutamate--homocysteine methyltransferase
VQRSENRILTTHTGSLPRPPELSHLYARRAAGEAIDAEALARAQETALGDAIAHQLEAGIDVGNNGEQTREAFFLYLRDRLTGLGGSWDRPGFADSQRYPEYARLRAAALVGKETISPHTKMPRAQGAVTYRDPALIEAECRELQVALAAQDRQFAEAFMSSPSPGILAAAILDEHYDDLERYLEALGEALRVEYKAITDAGFILQLDCPDLALEHHVSYQDKPLSEFLAFVGAVVATINRALQGIPRERVRMHVCWGNSASPHDCDVPLRDILPILRSANVGAFVLPFSNPRHAHEYKLVRDLLDDDQLIVAGVVDPQTNVIEHPEVISDRLERVVEVVGDPRRVLAGTDCGFETSTGMGAVASDVVWAKLASMAEGAKLVSQRLMGVAA